MNYFNFRFYVNFLLFSDYGLWKDAQLFLILNASRREKAKMEDLHITSDNSQYSLRPDCCYPTVAASKKKYQYKKPHKMKTL